jgi:hypothetical protein
MVCTVEYYCVQYLSLKSIHHVFNILHEEVEVIGFYISYLCNQNALKQLH